MLCMLLLFAADFKTVRVGDNIVHATPSLRTVSVSVPNSNTMSPVIESDVAVFGPKPFEKTQADAYWDKGNDCVALANSDESGMKYLNILSSYLRKPDLEAWKGPGKIKCGKREFNMTGCRQLTEGWLFGHDGMLSYWHTSETNLNTLVLSLGTTLCHFAALYGQRQEHFTGEKANPMMTQVRMAQAAAQQSQKMARKLEAEKENAVSQLQSQVQALGAQAEQQTKELERTNNARQTVLENSLTALREQIIRLTQERDSANQRAQQAEVDTGKNFMTAVELNNRGVESARKELATQQTDLEQAQKAVRDAKEQLAQEERRLKEMRTQLTQSATDLAERTAMADTRQGKIEQQQMALSQQEQVVQSKISELKEHEDTMHLISKGLKYVKKHIQELFIVKKMLRIRGKQLDLLRQERQQHEEQILDLGSQIVLLQKKVNDKDQAIRRLQGQTTDIIAKEDGRRQLQVNYSRVHDQLNAVQEVLNSSHDQNRNLQDQLEQFRKESAETLEQRIQQKGTEISELQVQIVQEQQARQTIMEEIDEKTRELENKKNALIEKERRIAGLERSVGTLSIENVSLKQALAEKQQLIDNAREPLIALPLLMCYTNSPGQNGDIARGYLQKLGMIFGRTLATAELPSLEPDELEELNLIMDQLSESTEQTGETPDTISTNSTNNVAPSVATNYSQQSINSSATGTEVASTILSNNTVVSSSTTGGSWVNVHHGTTILAVL